MQAHGQGRAGTGQGTAGQGINVHDSCFHAVGMRAVYLEGSVLVSG